MNWSCFLSAKWILLKLHIWGGFKKFLGILWQSLFFFCSKMGIKIERYFQDIHSQCFSWIWSSLWKPVKLNSTKSSQKYFFLAILLWKEIAWNSLNAKSYYLLKCSGKIQSSSCHSKGHRNRRPTFSIQWKTVCGISASVSNLLFDNLSSICFHSVFSVWNKMWM